MKRLIKSAIDLQTFQTAIKYVKDELKKLNLFKDPVNDSDVDNTKEVDFNLLFKDEYKNLFIITGIGRGFDELINSAKNQYNIQLSLNVLNDNSGFLVKIENLDDIQEEVEV